MTAVLLDKDLAIAIRDFVRDEIRRSPNPTRRQPQRIATPHDYSIRVGKVDAAVSAGESVSVSIYSGTTKGSETDTGDNVTAYLRYSELAIGAWCHVAFIDGGWEILIGDPCWEP